MIINIKNPTYKYKKPVEFCQEKYYDSKSLVEAVLDNWDAAITIFKCGNWERFWSIHVEVTDSVAVANERKFAEIFNTIWSYERDTNPDVLFSKIIHIIEPAMKEIPCFIGSLEEIKLWKAEDFKAYFNHRIPSKSDAFLKEIVERDFLPEPGSAFDEDEESVLYACNMLREEVFTEFGYTNIEKPFFDMLSSKKSGKEWDKFNFKAVYQRIAEGFYERDIFCYRGKEYTSLNEFAQVWEQKIHTWSMKQWNTFIEEVFVEENGRTSFLQWIKQICPQGNVLAADFRQWKMRFDRKPELRETLPKPEEVSLEGYLKWGTQKEHDGVWEECVQKNENILIWKKSHSECSKVEDLENLYFIFYDLLQQICRSEGYPWEELELKRELNQIMQSRKAWEIMVEQEYYDKRELLKAIRSHDVLSCLEHNFLNDFIYGGQKVDKKVFLPVLACASVKESYKEDCKQVRKLLEEWIQSKSCDLERIRKILIIIYESIYLELFKVSAPDEVIDYYFDYMKWMAVTLLGESDIGVVIDDSTIRVNPVKNFLLERIDKNAGSIWKEDVLWDSSKAGKITGGLRELSKRRSVDYTEFYKQDVYKNWISAKKRVSQIEEQWKSNSILTRIKSEDIITYVNENWCIRNLTQMRDGVGPIRQEVWQALEKVKKNQQELKEQVAAANVKYDAVRSACKDYEAAWDNKQKEKAEAEKQKKIKELRRKEAMKKVRKACCIIIVIFLLGKISDFAMKLSVNKVTNDTLTWNFNGGTDYTRKVLKEQVKLNGVLKVPSAKVVQLYDIPDDVKKLVISEGTQELKGCLRLSSGQEIVLPESLKSIGDSVFSESSITEIDLPDSLEYIGDYAFSGTGIVEIELPESLKYIGNSAFSRTGITEINLPDSLEHIGQGVFQEMPLTEVILPESLKYIGGSAFERTALTEIVLPESLEYIGSEAFDETAITKIDLPDSLTEMGAAAFASCPLTEIHLPKSIELIDYHTFRHAKITEIDIPQNVKYICNYAFSECENLQKIYIRGNIEFAVDGHIATKTDEVKVFPRENDRLEFILDSNGTYSKEMLRILESYNRPVKYVDFNAIGR